MAVGSLPVETCTAQVLVPKINEIAVAHNATRAVAAASTSLTVTSTFTAVTCGASSRTATLPAPTAEARYTVAKVDAAGAGTLVVTSSSGNFIGRNIAGTDLSGTTVTAPASHNASVSVISDGTDWFITSLVGVWT